MSQYFDNKELFVGPTTTQYGSHMVTTNVLKETKMKYVNIDTRFQDEYNFNSVANLNVTLPERINDAKRIRACSAEIPMSIFNISSDLKNNCFTFGENTIIIPNGNYDANGLVSVINSKIQTMIDSSINVYIISNNNVCFENRSYNNYDINFAVDSNGNFDKYNVKSKLGWLMGFRDISYTLNSNMVIYTTLVSESMINMSGPKYLYLVIDEFSRGNQNSFLSPIANSFINKNILARITVDSQHYPYGSILTANLFNGLLLSDHRSYNGKIDLQKLNIQIVDEYGNPVNLNGLDFSFCLEIEHV